MIKTQADLLALTPEQKKALSTLKRAFTACSKAGLYVWDDYGSLSAVNGKHIARLGTDSRYGEVLDRGLVERFNPKCYGPGCADDPLYIERK